MNKVLSGDQDSVQAADMFGRDASLFGRVLNAMLEGNEAMGISRVSDVEALDRLAAISELFQFVSGSVDEILETSPELFQVDAGADVHAELSASGEDVGRAVLVRREEDSEAGGGLCEPVDLPVNKRHYDMVYAHMRYSDKPFMGSVTAPERARDTVELARLTEGQSDDDGPPRTGEAA